MQFDEASVSTSAPTIGVLALQGDYQAHCRILMELGATPKLVRSASDLDDLQGLVIPGGESTVMSRLCDRYSLTGPLKAQIEAGLPTLGTCAGLIFLANQLEGATSNFAQTTLQVLDVCVARNAYGAQTDSFETDLFVPELDQTIRAVFIRAPRIESIGAEVEVLATFEGAPVMVRQGAVVALAFHPEIAGENRVHKLWLDALIRQNQSSPIAPSHGEPSHGEPSHGEPLHSEKSHGEVSL